MKLAIEQLLQVNRANPRSSERPPKIEGVEWSPKGVGWDCRQVYFVGKQRRRRHLKHLGRGEWERWQRDYPGAALKAHVERWVAEQVAAKTIEE